MYVGMENLRTGIHEQSWMTKSIDILKGEKGSGLMESI